MCFEGSDSAQGGIIVAFVLVSEINPFHRGPVKINYRFNILNIFDLRFRRHHVPALPVLTARSLEMSPPPQDYYDL